MVKNDGLLTSKDWILKSLNRIYRHIVYSLRVFYTSVHPSISLGKFIEKSIEALGFIHNNVKGISLDVFLSKSTEAQGKVVTLRIADFTLSHATILEMKEN